MHSSKSPKDFKSCLISFDTASHIGPMLRYSGEIQSMNTDMTLHTPYVLIDIYQSRCFYRAQSPSDKKLRNIVVNYDRFMNLLFMKMIKSSD